MGELERNQRLITGFVAGRAARAIRNEAVCAALMVRGSEMLARDMMDSTVRMDDYRLSKMGDSDTRNAMLLDLQLGHHQTMCHTQANLYRWS